MCLAIPGRIVEYVDEVHRLAKVDVGGVRRTVNVGLLDAEDGTGVVAGDWVLVHVGFAMSRIDDDEAQSTLQLLREMGEAFEQELEELRESQIE